MNNQSDRFKQNKQYRYEKICQWITPRYHVAERNNVRHRLYIFNYSLIYAPLNGLLTHVYASLASSILPVGSFSINNPQDKPESG